MLKITLTSGLVGKKDTQRKVITALGLRKYGSSVVHADSPTIRSMINKVSHLVTVAPAADSDKKSTKPAAKVAEKKAPAAKTKQTAESK